MVLKEGTTENKENLKNSCITNNMDTNRRVDDNLDSSKLNLSDLQSAKRGCDDKHRELEDRMRQSELHAERMALERDKLNVELDRLILELKQTKMELALSEERKEEIELALKKEIKFLINKMVSAKGTSIQLSPREISHFVFPGGSNKSLGDTNSFINNSGFLNQSCLGFTSQMLGQVYSPIENSNMSVIQENILKRSAYICSPVHLTKPDQKFFKRRNMSEGKTSPSESPRKLNEFENNESAVLKNIVNTKPKKLILDLLPQ